MKNALLSPSQLGGIFREKGLPFNGHHIKYARRLQSIGTLDANNLRDRANMGFSSPTSLQAFTDRLVQAGIAAAFYDAEGKLALVKFIWKGQQ